MATQQAVFYIRNRAYTVVARHDFLQYLSAEISRIGSDERQRSE
jgi:hypothetical protein